MNFTKILIIFLFNIMSYSYAQEKQLFQGDSCTHNNQQGVCRLISECPKAQQELKSGIRPKHCGFDKKLPIVCCLDSISVREPTKQTRIPGEISKKKCLDYRKYIAYASWNGIPVLNRADFPHMVSLGYQQEGSEVKWGCGGSIISEKFILTAGHCITNKRLGPPTLVMTDHVLLKNDSKAKVLNVVRAIAHPDYKPPVNYHDIGLVEVESIYFNLFARPACLKLDTTIDTNRVIATGWGKVGILGPLSNILLRVDLELFNQSDCQNVYSGSEKAPQGIRYDVMVCAGSYKEIKDVCQGDSGGPLQSINKNYTSGMIEILGIVSFGKPCGQQPRWPGVYTRVSAYLKWIEDIVWPEE